MRNTILTVDTLVAELSYSLATSKCSVEGMSNIVSNYARTVTQSKNSYVSLLHEESGDNICYTLTGMIGNNCQMKENVQGIVFPKGKDGSYPSLWGHSLNTRRAFYTNDPKSHFASRGLPENHIIIRNFLSVPVIMGDTLLGQISLANCDSGYCEEDVRTIQRISTHFALAVYRQKELDFLQDTYKKELMEEKIKQLKTIGSPFKSFENNDVFKELKDEIYVLNMLVKRKDADREKLESSIRENITKLVLPHLNQLREQAEDPDTKARLDILYQNILEVFSPLPNTFVSMNIHLTPQEAQIALLVKAGMPTKEICQAMNLSANTVNFHRKNIRAKFSLTSKKINLRTYLCSLEESHQSLH